MQTKKVVNPVLDLTDMDQLKKDVRDCCVDKLTRLLNHYTKLKNKSSTIKPDVLDEMVKLVHQIKSLE